VLEIRKRDRAGRVLALPNQTPGLLQQVGLTRIEVDYEVWVIDSAGKKYHGALAANLILQHLGGFWRLVSHLYSIQPFSWLEDRAYRWVAEHRSLLSRWWGAVPECEQPGITCE
jgi:predicted DCC family thiol-disulfide oxidoreductase YuxK